MGNVPTPPKADWWEKTKQVAGDALTSGMGPVGLLIPHGIPVGDLAEKQASKGPDDPSRWFLNTVQDLGIVSAKTLQGLTSPSNIALIGLMSTGNEEAALPVLAKLGFSAEMAKDATQSVAKGVAEAKKGNLREAGRLFGSAGVNSLLILLGAKKGKNGFEYRRLSSEEAPLEALPGNTAAPKTSSVPLPTVQDAELVDSPRPPEQRLDKATRMEVDDFRKLHPEYSREEVLQGIKDARAEKAKPGKGTDKATVPAPAEPVPPPPDIIVHPKTVHSEGTAATVTPDDVRAYVEAATGGKPMKVTGSDGEAQDLADPESSEAARVRDVKLSRPLHDELFPGGKFRAGMTVGQAVDAQPGVRHPETGRKFSSTQIDLPKEAASKVSALANSIPDEDLSGDGRETKPHVTVKYGLHDDEPEGLQSFLRDNGPITLTLGKTNFFPPSAGSEGNDVVIVEVDSPQLHGLNSDISKTFQASDTHPDYKPHITLAYVKPGSGKKYAGNTSLEGQKVEAKEITFSSRNGQDHAIKLGGKPAAKLQSVPPPPQDSKQVEPTPKPGAALTASGGGVPKAPELKLTPTLPARPVPEPGWKLSLESYPPARAQKYKKEWGPYDEAIRLIPDPLKKGNYWVSYKPKVVAPAGQKALGPAPKIPFTKPTGPMPASFESRDGFVLRRLKELTTQIVGLMAEGKDVPAEVEAEHERLDREFHAAWQQEDKEAAEQAEKDRAHYAPARGVKGPAVLPEASQRPLTPTAPSPEPIPEPTPEEKARQEVIRSGVGVKWLGLRDTPEGQRVLVVDPRTKATLSLPSEGLTRDAIERAVEEGRQRYDAARNPDEPLPVGPPKRFIFERAGFLFAGKKKIPVEFGYMERSDVVGSHDYKTFTKNPEHPGQQRYSYEADPEQQADLERFFMQPEPDQVLSDAISGMEGPPVVIRDGAVAGGNKRTMWVNKMYDSRTPYEPVGNISRSKFLRDAVVKVAQRNDVAGVEEMKEPVRVRRIAAPETMGEWMDLTGALNVNMSAEPKPGEHALFYAGRITPSTVAAIAESLQELNPDASIRQFMAAYPTEFVDWLQKSGAIGPKERLKYLDAKTGGLNENGKALFENALLAKVLNDARLIDSSPQQVVSTLASCLAPILRIGVRGGDWDMRPMIMRAAEVMGEASREGIPLQTRLDQAPLFQSGPGSRPPIPMAVKALAEFLDRDIPLVKKGMRQFAAESEVKGGTRQGSFISEDPEPFDSFKAAFTQPTDIPEPRDRKGNLKAETVKAKEKRLLANEESKKRMARYAAMTKEDYESALREAYKSQIRANKERFDVRPGD